MLLKDSIRKIRFKNLELGIVKTTQKSFSTVSDANAWVEQFTRSPHLKVISVIVEDHLILKERLRQSRGVLYG